MWWWPTRWKAPLERGVRFAPRCYRLEQLELLAWLLRSGCEDVKHSIAVEWATLERIPVLDVASSLVVITGEHPANIGQGQDVEGELLARASRLGAYATVVLHDGARLTQASWLNRTKHAFATATRTSFEAADHPLAAIGIAHLPVARAEELTMDPLELIELLDATLRFQLKRIAPMDAAPAGDDHEPPSDPEAPASTALRYVAPKDWQYALAWNVADAIAKRLASGSAQDEPAAWNAARILLGLALPQGANESAAWGILARTALADVDHATLSLGPLGRAANEPNIAPRLREALRRHGLGHMPELLAEDTSQRLDAKESSALQLTPPIRSVLFTAKDELVKAATPFTERHPLMAEVVALLNGLSQGEVEPTKLDDPTIQQRIVQLSNSLKRERDALAGVPTALLDALGVALHLFNTGEAATLPERRRAVAIAESLPVGDEQDSRRLRSDARYRLAVELRSAAQRAPQREANEFLAEAARELQQAMLGWTQAAEWSAVLEASALASQVISHLRTSTPSAPRGLDEPPSRAAGMESAGLESPGASGSLETKRLFEVALAANPNDANNLGNFALFLHRQGELAEARSLYQSAIEADPKHANNLGNFAVFLSKQGELEQARSLFQRAIEADPNHAHHLGNFARFLENQGELERARSLYQRAIDADPQNAINLGSFAVFLKNQGELEQARSLYQRAIDADPQNAINLGNFALFLENQGELERARSLYQRAIDADPHHANILGNFADFLENQGELEQARSLCQRAIDADPHHAHNLGNFALFLENQGDLAEARPLHQRAVEAAPNDANILANYVRHLYWAGNPSEARQQLDRALRLGGVAPTVQLELQLYRYAHTEERDAALRELAKLLSAGTRSPGWELGPNVEVAREQGHPDLALLQAIVDVATKGAPFEMLDAFDAWRTARASVDA